jgi:CheY-like chemotaxis protein
VVYGLLRGYGGGLRLGPDPAQGTAVRVFLPLAAVATRPAAAEGRARVLAVDDDPLVLRFVAATLEGAGYQVQAAAGGAEALRLYTTATVPFHLVLTDVVMPHIDGVELARRLRAHDPAVALLFLSGEVPAAPLVEGLGPIELLPKPFRAETLVRAVRIALAEDPGPGTPARS